MKPKIQERREQGMKISKGMQWAKTVLFSAAFVGVFFVMGIVSHAETTGKVVAKSANIRQEANTTSTALASVVANNSLSVIGKVTGSDGRVWYQVYVDADQKGYIRSDLITVADESQVPSLDGSTTTTTTTTEVPTATVDPTGSTEVTPVSGTVAGANNVNVRATASKNGGWVGSAPKNTSVTVTGYIDASDGRWYLVNFMNGGNQVVGYIRSDYVNLSGELIAPSAGLPEETPDEPLPSVDDEPGYESAEPEAPEENKPYDVGIVNEKWYLFDYEAGKQYAIQDFIAAVDGYKAKLADTEKKLTSKNIIIAILAVLLVIALAGVGFMVFRSMSSEGDEYPPKREKAPVRRPEGQNRNRQQAVRKQAPAGQRPAGQGTRRPAQTANRPVKQTATADHDIKVKEPAPAVRQRPVDSVSDDTKVIVQAPELATEPVKAPEPVKETKQEPKSKNFLQEDDEFEFEFLNWSGDEEE